MLDRLRVYRQREYALNSKITLRQPTLGEICDYGEREYMGIVYTLCATPADRKAEIWDTLHVYWDAVDEYDVFISAFRSLAGTDLSLILPGLDAGSFVPVVDPALRQISLRNPDGVIIDRAIHALMTEYLRAVHRLRKNVDYGVNDYTRDIMIEDDRDARAAAEGRGYKSMFLPLVSALTNDAGFKYRFDDVWNLPVGVFLDAAARVMRRADFDHLMTGIYSGCVDVKKVNKKDLYLFGELRDP